MKWNDPFESIDDGSCLDLRVGNPRFLYSYWDNFLNTEEVPHYDYPLDTPDPKLLDSIVKLHTQVGNVLNIENKHIVITSGATNALHSVISVLAKRRKNKTLPFEVYARPPFWPRFREISQNANGRFTNFQHIANLTIQTVPNNPDMAFKIGNLDLTNSDPDQIYDLSYNWNTYSPTVYSSDDKVAIFSMAKLSGNAGLRLGWAVFKDPHLASEVAKLIEIQSSGVSREAQTMGSAMMKEILFHMGTKNDFFEFARKKIEYRWSAITSCLLDLGVMAEIKNDKGMFLYGQSVKLLEIFERNDILYVPGGPMGIEDDHHFRINLGCSDKDFEKLIDILEGESNALR